MPMINKRLIMVDRKQTKSLSKIRKSTLIANIAILSILLFFAYFGYKNLNWILEFVCLAAFPFYAWNFYKYFFNKNYRKHFNEYRDKQRALPKKERDDYRFKRFLERNIGLGLIGLGIVILVILIYTKT